MTVSTALPQMEIVTKSLARASVRRARKSLEDAAAEVVWQVEREVWVVLGYKSWTEMREAEYGGSAFIVPSKNRPELVARMRAKGLTQQEIADTAGVNAATISRDLANASSDTPAITNSRGQQRPATYARTEPDVVDADVIEDDEETEADWLDDEPAHVNTETGEIAPNATTDSVPAESAATTVSCPTCHGTGKVTRS